MQPLPIDAVLPDLAAKLREAGAVVLRAPTGAGKTTRVPPALIGDRRVLLLEPRRVAARAAARRMAIESDTPLGDRFGYSVRFDKKYSDRTRVVAVTPGILLRQLHDDPFLEAGGTVIFDEFHERGLESDLALGLVKLLRQTVRPDLKIVVMSATLDVDRIASYLGDCPVIVSEGRSFPVAIRYRPRRVDTPMVDAAASAVRDLWHETKGDLLAFLPGLGEIRRLEEQLGDIDGEVLPLHGDLPPEQQDRALTKLERRKIVLATNVAETSVTVEGVTAVIDTGQARQLDFDAAVGMNRLRLAPISKASADQRAGRAGRTQPGICVRLWDEPGHAARPEQTEPEIRRADLASTVLQLLAMKEDVRSFPWLDPPRPEAVASALLLLAKLGATDEKSIDDLAAMPVHPRLGRLLLEGERRGVAVPAAMAAAILSDRDPFDRETLTNAVPSHSDLLDRVEALEEFEATGRTQFPNGMLHRGGAKQTLLARDQYLRLLGKLSRGGGWASDDLLQAIFAAYPDRLCRRRERNDRRALMLGGRGVRLAPQSGVIEPDIFVAIDVDAGGVDALVRIASEVRREWLPREKLESKHELEFTGDRVVAWKRTRFDGLIVDESPGHIADNEEAATLLTEAARATWEKVAPSDDSDAGAFLRRLRSLRQWRPDFNLPDVDLPSLLLPLCRGCRSFEDVRRADWLDAIRSSLEWKQVQLIEREAPVAIVVPSGREVPLQYLEGRPPVLAAKIQELFGLKETPRIAGGTIKVLVHLLAPNGRPQQVTDDLASFWANTYATVRKELRGRYPKHDWPEDPTAAIPSRGVRRKEIH